MRLGRQVFVPSFTAEGEDTERPVFPLSSPTEASDSKSHIWVYLQVSCMLLLTHKYNPTTALLSSLQNFQGE